tara:strand:- start:1224 stop:2267 length:1044 start_codon:yes stop_codon:yes gene_type:complete
MANHKGVLLIYNKNNGHCFLFFNLSSIHCLNHEILLDMNIIAGVDEVGRGPLAGPVVAGAVVLPDDHRIEGLRDSKKLTKKKREGLYPIIMEHALGTGIGKVSVEKIDEMNIREATFLAMERALKNLPMVPNKALIDGEALKTQKIPNVGIIKGDDKVDSIKAASIIAKVTRDKIMSQYGKIFTEYGFEQNSGYGTKIHMDALKKYKSTPIHRRSFSPVKKQMPTIHWLEENHRIPWMCEKLAGLYLMDKNYEVLKMNHGDSKINIHAKSPDNKNIYAKVIPNSIAGGEDNIFKSLQKNDLVNSISTEESQENTNKDSGPHRVDALTIQLVKNNSPIIKHFKGIIEI